MHRMKRDTFLAIASYCVAATLLVVALVGCSQSTGNNAKSDEVTGWVTASIAQRFNQTSESREWAFDYDKDGNLVSDGVVGLGYDDEGLPITYGGFEVSALEVDSKRRVASFEVIEGQPSDPVQVLFFDFEYYESGSIRRIVKQVDEYGDGGLADGRLRSAFRRSVAFDEGGYPTHLRYEGMRSGSPDGPRFATTSPNPPKRSAHTRAI